MINILHLIETSETGGAETIYLELLKRLNKQKFHNYAGLFSQGWLSEQLSDNGINAKIFNTNRSFDLKLIFNIVKFLKKQKIDLIHSHLFGANVYSSIAGVLCNIPVISTLHGTVDVHNKDKLKKVKFGIINYFSKTVYVSNSLREYFQEINLGNIKKSTVIYNGIDLIRFSKNKCNISRNIKKELHLSNSDILIGSIGDLRGAKGYDVLIDAAARLIDEDSRYQFVVAGSITDLIVKLQQKITYNNIEKHFHFLGYQEDVPDILSQLDVFVLPSTTEGFSLSTIEAMAAKIPVVATKSGGPEEIITNGKDGILVNINSPKEIADAIKSYIGDKKFTSIAISNALLKVEEKFSIERMIIEYQNLYSQYQKKNKKREYYENC